MLETSPLYKELFSLGSIQELQLEIDGIMYGDDIIYDYVTVSKDLFDTDTFTVGSFTVGALETKVLIESEKIPRNAIVKFYYRYTDGVRNSEWVKKFEGKVFKRVKHTQYITSIEVYDYAANYEMFLDVFPNELKTFPANTLDVANLCASRLGLLLDNPEVIYNANIITSVEDYTLVELIQMIGKSSGGNWIITENNRLRLVVASQSEIVGDYEVQQITDSVLLTPITMIKAHRTTKFFYSAGTADGSILEINNPWATQAGTDYIYDLLDGYEYVPVSGQGVYADPAIQVGDTITYLGGTTKQLVASVKWRFDRKGIADISAPQATEDGYDDPYYLLTQDRISRNTEEVDSLGVTDYKLNIHISRAQLAVMNEGYWTTETIREKEGLGDLSLAVQRERAHGSPTRIYNIYVENGLVKTATREYPDFFKEKWKEQFSVGSGNAVAIAFNGEWQQWRDKWQLKTDENPWIFWVNNSGELVAQLWDNVSTRAVLATNVVKVKAIRAWKNVNFPDRDQGVVAGYIKTDGKVYYRNYCDQINGTTIWESEKEVFDGTAVNLNLFITNDYRMGFVIQGSDNKNYWKISSRNWAGMGITPDVFLMRARAKVDFLGVTYHKAYEEEVFTVQAQAMVGILYGGSANYFTSVANVESVNENFGEKVIFETQYKLFNFDVTDFEMVDSNDNKFVGISAQQISDNQFEITFQDFNNAVGDLTLRCLGTLATNEVGTSFNQFEKTFTPIGLVPTQIDAPEVEEIWNE